MQDGAVEIGFNSGPTFGPAATSLGLRIMATRSRKVAEPKGTSSARVGTPVTGATSSATTSRTRVANTGTTATTRATRSTKTTTATNVAVKDVKSAPAVKKPVVRKATTLKTKPAVEATDEIDREPIQVGIAYST